MSVGLEMQILTTLKKTNRIKLSILAAIFLLIAGFSIWLYTTSVIKNQTQILNSPNLTQEEIWSYEGSLEWWKITNNTTVTPLTTIMITAGLTSLIAPVAWTKMHHRQTLKAFSEKLELASAEKFEIE